MKKLVLMVALMVALTGVATASPLTDYSLGKVAADISWRPNVNLSDSWRSEWWDGQEDHSTGSGSRPAKRATWDWGVSVGLGNKFAIQYDQYNPATSLGLGFSSHEFNLLYQLSKNLSVFAGHHQAKYIDYTPGYMSNKNSWQGGLIGYGKIADKTSLYGIIGLGSGLVNWEAGVSYEICKNVDFNLSYRYKKVKNMHVDIGYWVGWEDMTAKGIGYGVTFKF